MKMDGFFECNGERIGYIISDNYSQGTIVIGGVEKMSRFIHYYNSKGKAIGTKNIYGIVEEMQNITPQMALNIYLE